MHWYYPLDRLTSRGEVGKPMALSSEERYSAFEQRGPVNLFAWKEVSEVFIEEVNNNNINRFY